MSHRWLPTLASILTLTASATAFADPPTPPPPPSPDSWAGQFLGVARAMQHEEGCTAHCFAIEKLTLTGSAATGALEFEMEGGVLAAGSADVPLFGPPASVRLESVTLGGAPALVAFDANHYFVRTDQKRFTIKGKITLGADRALALPGPINTVDATLKDGRVTEGSKLSGVLGTTLHFDAEHPDVLTAEPTVFQLSRSLHVGKRTEFTYKLTMRSGTDLGVVRLPLRYAEHVLAVTGADGWKVEGNELLLPTSNKCADVTISGDLPAITTFTPDPRSPYEWWLLEADPEHRLLVSGDAKQHDSSESPIARLEPSSKLFLVSRGQHLDVTVQTLASLDVLAGVVQRHSRTLVLTAEGDLVSDEDIAYDNSGIDYLLYSAPGKPIFLSTDGSSERLLHKDGTPELMIPLRVGTHDARLQSLDHVDQGTFGGSLKLLGPTFPLTASHASMTLGLPKGVRPIAVLGGDETQWSLDWKDALAGALSLGLALALLRGKRERALGTATLAGLWFASPALFLGAIGVGVLGGAAWATGRLFEGKTRIAVRFGLTAAAALVFLTMHSSRSEYAPASTVSVIGGYRTLDQSVVDTPTTAPAEAPMDALTKTDATHRRDEDEKGKLEQQRLGNYAGQIATNGIVDGVRPVAMPLPSYDHAVTITREIVTADRPFNVTLVYVTETTLRVLSAAWIVCMIGLGWSMRDRLRAWRDAIKSKLSPAPVPEAAE